MFDTKTCASAQPPPTPVIQFVSIEIMPTGDGRLAVSLAGTYLDEELLQFVNGEIASARAASLDEALTIIRNAVAETLGLSAQQKGS
ncbi:MAG: hypothetical protein FJX45_19500 [Alphaproteobacteria bacterium]|nr:hypothetical protein [Alphaproteobacteria bacterium]MBM3654188.1 hypothetical protein [Alphaproteobacteria bacterium]